MMSRALLLLVFSSVLFLLVRSLPWACLSGVAPTLGAKSKRIALVAELPSIRGSSQFGYCSSSLIVLGLVVGCTPVASPLQKNQLATPPPYCRYFAGVGTSCSYCGSACYCCCARYKAVAVPVFEITLFSVT